MPELPEVHTTVEGLNRVVKNKKILDVWSSYNSPFHKGKENIKNIHYFKNFKSAVLGAVFSSFSRRGKNVLMHLSNKHTILIHMKMTGHLLYGKYIFKNKKWITAENGPLQDPYNQFIRLAFKLSNGKYLVFSDLRKFGKVFVFPTEETHKVIDLSGLGPEPLSENFTYKKFEDRLLLRPNGRIKQVLMDQKIIAGIGNIYSDEMLWGSGIHPLSRPRTIPKTHLKKLYSEMKDVLKRGIKFGGDSESDYRNIYGQTGNFQKKHHAYRHTGEKCHKSKCGGKIERLKIGGRSAHFCPKHQKLFS